MLVSAKDMLQKAKAGKYAVGQFNINNLEWTKAVLQAAQECNSPVILGVSEGAGKYMTGFKTVAAMVEAMVDEMGITVPVALHLDHGTYEGCYKCIEAGFSSIMFDGSHYPIEENIEKTKELVKICNEKGMSLEAEMCIRDRDGRECRSGRRRGREEVSGAGIGCTASEHFTETDPGREHGRLHRSPYLHLSGSGGDHRPV